MGLVEDYEAEMMDSVTIYSKLFSYHKTVQQAVIYTLIDRYCQKHKIGVKEFCKDYLSDHMEAEKMFVEL